MDFLNHREGGMVLYQVFIFSPKQCAVTGTVEICKRLREFKEIKSQGKAVQRVEWLWIARRKILKTFLLDCVQNFGLRSRRETYVSMLNYSIKYRSLCCFHRELEMKKLITLPLVASKTHGTGIFNVINPYILAVPLNSAPLFPRSSLKKWALKSPQ
jgi:hypothetical protein